MSDRALDHVTNLIDRGIEIFLPFDEFPVGQFAEPSHSPVGTIALLATTRRDFHLFKEFCISFRVVVVVWRSSCPA
jgi:hypothetical protein